MKLTFGLFCFVVAAIVVAILISCGMMLVALMMLGQLVEAAR